MSAVTRRLSFLDRHLTLWIALGSLVPVRLAKVCHEELPRVFRNRKGLARCMRGPGQGAGVSAPWEAEAAALAAARPRHLREGLARRWLPRA